MSSAGAPAVALRRAPLPPAGCNCTTLHTLPLSRGPSSSSISRQDITAYLRRKLQDEHQSISTGASYVAVRVSSVVSAQDQGDCADIPPTSRRRLNLFGQAP